MAQNSEPRKVILVLGIKPGDGREDIIFSYLAAGGYSCRLEQYDNIADGRPLGIVLDISPFSDDGWGLLIKIKGNPATRNIPVLPVYLSNNGKVGGVFPVAGFFMLPIDEQYFLDRLAVYGLTEDLETWDLQVLVASRSGEQKLSKALETLGFEVVKGYTGKEALALTSIHPHYLVFCSHMLPDMSGFELLEKYRRFPYSRNIPIFVLLKGEMKSGEKAALSREIAHLVSKNEFTCEEFLAHLRRRE